jgi:hypothetical protein
MEILPTLALPIRMQMRTNPKGYEAHSVEYGVTATAFALEYLRENAATAFNIKYKGKYHRKLTEDDICFSFTIGGSTGNG